MRFKQIIFLLFACTLSCAWAISPGDALNQRLAILKTLQGDYVQISDDVGGEGKKVVSGTVVMERPNKFRWEIEKPYHQTLLSDAKQFYIFDEDLDQVVIRPVSQSLQDAPALLLIGETGDVTKSFTVRQTSLGGIQEVFTLYPRDKESMIKSIALTYQGSVLQSMRFQDTLDQVVEIQFTRLRQNSSVADDTFTLKIPKGVDVIREE